MHSNEAGSRDAVLNKKELEATLKKRTVANKIAASYEELEAVRYGQMWGKHPLLTSGTITTGTEVAGTLVYSDKGPALEVVLSDGTEVQLSRWMQRK